MNLIEQLFNDFSAKYLEEAKNKGVDLGLQAVYTPIDKIEKATGFRFADYITAETRSVAVLFNNEFINYFIKELPQNYINNIKFTFFYDCEFDYKQVRNYIFFSGNKLNIEMIPIENIKDLNKVMTGKKFDIVFSNPPYDRSLHLKILSSLYKDSITKNAIWISPIRWIESFSKFIDGSYSKNEKIVLDHIECIHPIFLNVAEKMFNAAFNFDLGIYILSEAPVKKFKFNPLTFQGYKHSNELLKIFEKVKNNIPSTWDKHIMYGKPSKVSVITSMICGGNGGRTKFLNKYFWVPFEKLCYQDNKRLDNGLSFYENRKLTCWGNVKPKEEQHFIQFETIDEAKNFYNSCNTIFWRVMHMLTVVDVHVHPEMLIFMDDYTSEWTDERFFEYFNITEDEANILKETLEIGIEWEEQIA